MQPSQSVTVKVKAELLRQRGCPHCFNCTRGYGDLVAKRRDGQGGIKVGRWTYGLYHEECEPGEKHRP